MALTLMLKATYGQPMWNGLQLFDQEKLETDQVGEEPLLTI